MKTLICSQCGIATLHLIADGLKSGVCQSCYAGRGLMLPAVASGAPTLDVIHHADALTLLRALPDGSVDCVVTSPPYYALRDYGVDGQIGLEQTPQQYIARLMDVFTEVRRVLKSTGTCWINLGDSYNGSGKASGRTWEDGIIPNLSGKQASNSESIVSMPTRIKSLPPKSLMMIPARFAIAMQDSGWILRNEICWSKKAPMPESVTDRCTKAHEMIYFFTKSPRYWSDFEAVREKANPANQRAYGVNAKEATGNIGGTKRTDFEKSRHTVENRNLRDVWHLPEEPDEFIPRMTGGNFSKRYADAQINHGGESQRRVYFTHNLNDVWHLSPEPTTDEHYAAYPTEIPRRCILAGCPLGGVVLDMFMGTGTTAVMARKLGRHYIGADLNPDYVAMARKRLASTDPFLSREVAPGLVQRSLFQGVSI